MEDPELVRFLAQSGTPVEVSITSNLRTGCCASLSEHPVRRLFEAGVRITLATDDPAMFGTTLSREYQLAQNAFGFTNDELKVLARNSFEVSFLSAEEQQKYRRLFS